MLAADLVFPSRLQHSCFCFRRASKASKPTAGADLSHIKDTDVNKSLSARNRTEMHLLPKFQAEATGVRQPEPAPADPVPNESTEEPLTPPVASGRKPLAIVERTTV
jgi:hypothetical protein